MDEAVACYRRALELKPDSAEAHNNLGNAWKDQGELDEAIACYRRALELEARPCRRTRATCCWPSNIARASPWPSWPPPTPSTSGSTPRRCGPRGRPHENVRDPRRRLRLGFVSPDFCRHPVGFF